jgi:hypothetical protein
MRDASNACICAPGLLDLQGDELSGCFPAGFSFNTMCKQPHERFDGSVVSRCECEAGFVRSDGPVTVSYQCVRPCTSGLGYDAKIDRCRPCNAAEDHVGAVCVPKCPTSATRDAASGECRTETASAARSSAKPTATASTRRLVCLVSDGGLGRIAGVSRSLLELETAPLPMPTRSCEPFGLMYQGRRCQFVDASK